MRKLTEVYDGGAGPQPEVVHQGGDRLCEPGERGAMPGADAGAPAADSAREQGWRGRARSPRRPAALRQAAGLSCPPVHVLTSWLGVKPAEVLLSAAGK